MTCSIALDLDGVLADIHTVAIDRSPTLDAYDPSAFGEEEWKEYKHRSYNVWHNHHEEIPLVEADAPRIVAELNAEHDVTILTHRTNVDGSIEAWLDTHEIPYDSLTPTHADKADNPHDVYVDDNPIPGADGRVLLYNHERNGHETDGYDERIDSLNEVESFLP